MVRAVVCVVLATLPALAWAQGSVGSRSGATLKPASSADPDTVLRARYSRYRTTWYIGFGLGAGGGWVSGDDGHESSGGLAFTVVRVGWVARPWFLVGFEGSTWFRLEGDVLDNRWVQFLHYDAVATLFPSYDSGLYGKAGAGLGVTMVESSVFGQTMEQRRDTGFDLKAGLGYEWQLLTAFNLGADLTYALTLFSGGRAHDLTAQVTFTWY